MAWCNRHFLTLAEGGVIINIMFVVDSRGGLFSMNFTGFRFVHKHIHDQNKLQAALPSANALGGCTSRRQLCPPSLRKPAGLELLASIRMLFFGKFWNRTQQRHPLLASGGARSAPSRVA